MPEYLLKTDWSDGEKIFEFNRAIIDATVDVAGWFKLQIAFYEALGLDGMRAFSKTLQYARSRGNATITDAKRGDIASTAEQYAKAHFSGDFETDVMTINVFMGEDAVSPYYPYLAKDKGVFALVKTSNPSGKDFQDLLVDGETLYERTARKVSEWGERFPGESGFSAIGAVTGLTYPEEFERIRPLLPHTFLLHPRLRRAGRHRQGHCRILSGRHPRRGQLLSRADHRAQGQNRRRGFYGVCPRRRDRNEEGHPKMAVIVSNQSIAKDVFRMTVSGLMQGRAGQFYLLSVPAALDPCGQAGQHFRVL